MYYVLSCLLIF
jgi:hypothetical protein